MTFTESNTVEALVRDILCGGVTHHTAVGPGLARRHGALSGLGWHYLGAQHLPRQPHEILVEDHVREALIRLNPDIGAQPGSGRRRAVPAAGNPDGRADRRAGQGERGVRGVARRRTVDSARTASTSPCGSSTSRMPAGRSLGTVAGGRRRRRAEARTGQADRLVDAPPEHGSGSAGQLHRLRRGQGEAASQDRRTLPAGRGDEPHCRAGRRRPPQEGPGLALPGFRQVAPDAVRGPQAAAASGVGEPDGEHRGRPHRPRHADIRHVPRRRRAEPGKGRQPGRSRTVARAGRPEDHHHDDLQVRRGGRCPERPSEHHRAGRRGPSRSRFETARRSRCTSSQGCRSCTSTGPPSTPSTGS